NTSSSSPNFHQGMFARDFSLVKNEHETVCDVLPGRLRKRAGFAFDDKVAFVLWSESEPVSEDFLPLEPAGWLSQLQNDLCLGRLSFREELQQISATVERQADAACEQRCRPYG